MDHLPSPARTFVIQLLTAVIGALILLSLCSIIFSIQIPLAIAILCIIIVVLVTLRGRSWKEDYNTLYIKYLKK
jgi:hypothetical protein